MTDGETDWISLTSDEFFLLWFAHHKVHHFPYFLGVGPVGRSRKDRAARSASASETLALRGLGTIEDPVAEAKTTIDVLATAPIRVELSYTGGAAPTLSVNAVQGTQAAMVVARGGSEVRLRTGDTARLQAALIDSVPPMEAGAEPAANVRTADFEKATEAAGAGGPRMPRDLLEDAGVRASEIPTIMSALQESNGRGTLAVKRREGTTDWRYAPSEVSWVDTVTGRYALRRAGEWTTIMPTGHARLRSMFSELLTESA